MTVSLEAAPSPLRVPRQSFSRFLFPGRFFGIRGFRPRIRLELESPKYRLKTVENAMELERVLRLRHRVFFEERVRTPRVSGMDFDRYDLYCDHILILDRHTGDCAGTYRLNCSLWNRACYSQCEFSMKNILKLPGTRLELGRACVEPRFRNGQVLGLLWKGIMAYARATGSRYLFGCSSIPTLDVEEIAGAWLFFRRFHLSSPDRRVVPRKKYALKTLNDYDPLDPLFTDRFMNSFRKKLPPLLRFYLNSGARICGEPALDVDFRCADFFTLLDTQSVSNSFQRRFTS
jgi:putative hemolysin